MSESSLQSHPESIVSTVTPDSDKKRSAKFYLKLFGSLGLTALLITVVHFWIGWSKLFQPWQTLSSPQVFGALSLLFFSYLLRAIRITQFFGLKPFDAFLVSARIMILHNFWNNLLPMRSGEISFPLLMQSHLNIRMSQSIPALLWFRLLDLQVLLLVGLVAFSSLWLNPSLAIFFGILGLIAPFGVYYVNKSWLKPKLTEDHHSWLIKLSHGMPNNFSQVIWSWLWTLLNWAIKLAVLVWIFTWLFSAPVANLTMGVLGGELSSVLPIHGLGGFGSYEAGVLLGFMDFGIDQKQLVVAAVNLHLMVLGSSLLAVLLALPMPQKPKNESK